MGTVRASEVLGDAIRLVADNFGTFLATLGVLALASAAISTAFSLAVPPPAYDDANPPDTPEEIAQFFSVNGPWFALTGVVSLITAVLGFLAHGMGIVAADAARTGTKIDFAAGWTRLRPRLGNLLATLVLLWLAVLGVMIAGAALFFLILPIFLALGVVVWLLVRWSVATVASVLESHRPTENFSRSASLVRGRFGAVFLTWLLVILIGILVSLVLGAPVMFAGYDVLGPTLQAPPPWLVLVGGVMDAVVAVVMGSLMAAVAVLLHARLAERDAPPAPEVVPAPYAPPPGAGP